MSKTMEVLRMQFKYKNTVVFVNDAAKVSMIYEHLIKCEFGDIDTVNDLSQQRTLDRIEQKWNASEIKKNGLILICQEVFFAIFISFILVLMIKFMI